LKGGGGGGGRIAQSMEKNGKEDEQTR